MLDGHTLAIPAVLEIPSKDYPYDASKDSILKRAKVTLCTLYESHNLHLGFKPIPTGVDSQKAFVLTTLLVVDFKEPIIPGMQQMTHGCFCCLKFPWT